MPSRHKEADLSRLRRTTIAERGGLIDVEQFVRPGQDTPDVSDLMSVVPDLFAGADFRRAVSELWRAGSERRTILVMFGAHVVKCGLSRLLIDLMERGVVTAVATNGAGAIHDFEIARWGKTSEDVAVRLEDGSFGTCEDTADAMNRCAARAAAEGEGFGESLGRSLVEHPAANLDASILGSAYRLGIPATVHVALGTDIVHEHASADGAAIGDASLRDFRILAEVVANIERGVVVNIGSAVILPEVFLKALSVARNLGGRAEPLTAIGMDMNEPYRAAMNVVGRPTAKGGMGIALRGRHEIMLPLLWAALRAELDAQREGPDSG
jgi:deoxyhypusine synthase